jgi:acyl dehydratase
VTVIDLAALSEFVGREIATSEWTVVSQDRINAFADTTDDHQWIHVDTERARGETPFGTTIAHGFLTLSLISPLMRNAVSIGNSRMTLNYGLNRVRFVSPVPAGSRIRARVTVGKVEHFGESTHVTWDVIIEREGSDKPCVAAEWIVRYYPTAASASSSPDGGAERS